MDRSHESTTMPEEPARVSRRGALKAGAAGLALALGLGKLDGDTVSQLARLAQGKPMTGARLAEILQAERAQWRALLAEVGPERMEIPGAAGEWSVKQLVAHLTWYEQAVLDGARQVMGGQSFTRPGGALEAMDERNARIAAAAGDRPLAGVLSDSEQVFSDLLTMLARVPDAMLNDATLLGLPDDIPPWMRVANNSYAHYREHAADLRAWLDGARA